MPDAAQPIVDFLTRLTAALGVNASIDVEETAAGPGSISRVKRRNFWCVIGARPLKALQHVVDMACGRTLPGGPEEFSWTPSSTQGKGRRAAADGEASRREGEADRPRSAAWTAQSPTNAASFHLAVAELPGVTTESVGDAFSKTVLISLRK